MAKPTITSTEALSFILLNVLNREEGGEETRVRLTLDGFYFGNIATLAATKEAA